MENIIKIKNLSFRYGNNFVFDKLNLDVKNGEWLSIVGPNGSGKSTLIRILAGLFLTDNDIYIENIKLNNHNLMTLRKKLGFVFENIDDQFVAETVKDDLAFALENLAYNPKDIDRRINEIAKKLHIEDILECEPHRLSGGEKEKVAIASALVTKPNILILDEAFSMLDNTTREEILKLLKQLHKSEELTIINVTHNLEETYYSDRIVVLEGGRILVDGPTKKVLKEDKILTNIGIEIPFMVDLSLKLMLYGLIDHIILDMDEMVNVLWK